MARIGKAKIVRADAAPVGLDVVEETVRVDWFGLQAVIDTLSGCGERSESLTPMGCRAMARKICRATGLQVSPPVPRTHAPVV